MGAIRRLFAEKGSLFGYEHSGSLSFFRFSYCLVLAVTLVVLAPEWDAYFDRREYSATPLFRIISPEAIPFEWFVGLRYVLVAALLAAALGVLTRPALVVATVTFFLYEGTHLGFTKPKDSDYTYHLTNLTVYFLAIMAMAPEIDRHGIRSLGKRALPAIAIPEWPRKAMLGMLCFAYFGAGYCRLVENPLWIDGHTMQAYLFDKYLRLDIDLGYWVAQSWFLCMLFSVFTMGLELTYLAVMFFPRLKPAFLIAGLSLHLGIYLTMKINFFVFFVYNYLLLVEWSWIVRAWSWIKRRPFLWAEPPRPTVPIPLSQKATCLAWIGLQAACVFVGVEKWPLSDFRVFRDRRKPEDVSVSKLATAAEGASPDWLPWRKQHLLRRAMTSEPERLIKRADRAEPEERAELLAEARQLIVQSIVVADPTMFERRGALKLYLMQVRKDPETGDYVVEERFIMDLEPPR